MNDELQRRERNGKLLIAHILRNSTEHQNNLVVYKTRYEDRTSYMHAATKVSTTQMRD
jgi:hypothetical protein